MSKRSYEEIEEDLYLVRPRKRLIKMSDIIPDHDHTPNNLRYLDHTSSCDICLEENIKLVDINKFFEYKQIVSNTPIRVCSTCIYKITIKIVEYNKKYTIEKPNYIYSKIGTSIYNINTQAYILLALFGDKARFILLDKSSTKKYYPPNHNKKRVSYDTYINKHIFCLYCDKLADKNSRNKFYDTEYYACNACNIYFKRESIKLGNIFFWLYVMYNIYMRCHIHDSYSNMYWILTKIKINKDRYGVMPICYECYKMQYVKQAKIC